MRLTNCQLGGRVTRESAQFPMTPVVAMSDMKVMMSEAPSRAPMMGRNESERNSKKVSSHENLPRGPWERAAALTSSLLRDAPESRAAMSGRAMISL